MIMRSVKKNCQVAIFYFTRIVRASRADLSIDSSNCVPDHPDRSSGRFPHNGNVGDRAEPNSAIGIAFLTEPTTSGWLDQYDNSSNGLRVAGPTLSKTMRSPESATMTA